MIQKIKNFLKKIKQDFIKELQSLEQRQNENFNKKIDNFKESIEQLEEANEMYKEILESQKNLIKLKEKIKTKQKIINETKIPEIDPEKFILFYSDDHPGALFQMFNDIRVVLEKRTHIADIEDDLIEEINKFELNLDFFNIISFKTDEAPFQIEYFLEKNIIPDIAILDIIFGGIILRNQEIVTIDGIDIAEEIFKKNPKAVILFYTGCNLSEYSKEGEKLKKLLENEKFKDKIFVVDKDINDNNRLQEFIKAFRKLIELNPEKYEKLKAKLCQQ